MRYKRGDVVDFRISNQNPSIYGGEITETLQRRCHVLAKKKDGKLLPKKKQFSVAVGYEHVVPKKIKLS